VKRPRRAALNSRGGTREWATFKDGVVREEPLCWLRLPGCTIRSQTADHIIPRKYRPDLILVRSNARGSCNHCNRARRATPMHLLPKLRAEMMKMPRYRQRKPPGALGFFE
jgi:5-methylcytosine-specific restriction endonuclease McrA